MAGWHHGLDGSESESNSLCDPRLSVYPDCLCYNDLFSTLSLHPQAPSRWYCPRSMGRRNQHPVVFTFEFPRLSTPATAWSRSRRRNPPRASWSLGPAQGCRTQRLGLGSPGVSSYCGRGRGAGQWKGEPRRGPGRPSRAGGLPSPPRSRQQPWLHGPPAVGPAGPHCGSNSGWRWPGTPAHGGKVQGEGPGRRLRRLWAPCVRLCVCMPSLLMTFATDFLTLAPGIT